MKIMASGPITSWQIDEETMETGKDFIFLGSKITADGNCSHTIKRCLLLGKEVMSRHPLSQNVFVAPVAVPSFSGYKVAKERQG